MEHHIIVAEQREPAYYDEIASQLFTGCFVGVVVVVVMLVNLNGR